MLEIQKLYYKIGPQSILEDISACIRPGQLTVLLGANGAGKSTLLKVLAGENKPFRGSVTLKGRAISSHRPQELALRRAVLTQQYSLSLPFRCREVVMMGRYPHFKQTPSCSDQELVRLAMEEMMVEQLADRWFHTLSGGEQQRVQMARVLAQLYPLASVATKFLLLDEPTSSMDCLQQQLCLRKAKELAQAGCTVVVVLHDLNLAAQYADQVLLLKNGKLLKAGASAEVFQPDLIRQAYGYEVEIIYHNGVDFPILLPVFTGSKQSVNAKKIA